MSVEPEVTMGACADATPCQLSTLCRPPTRFDFYHWSNANLLENTTRGRLAEFLVAHVLGVTDTPREEWADWDVESPAGVRIEVKSAAYVQSWAQRSPSAIRFSIAPSTGWNTDTNTPDRTRKRRADVYVFCLLGSVDDPDPDPLNLDDWRFFVLPTRTLDEQLGAQKSAALSTLRRLGAQPLRVSALHHAIEEAAGRPLGAPSHQRGPAPARTISQPDSPFFNRPRIAENALAFAIEDAFPVSPGHALVIPHRVIPTWFDATPEEQRAIFALVDEVKLRLDAQTPRPDGYNVGFNAGAAAGQTVMHLHVHVIPRYVGDMADPRGGVRHVIPSRGNYLSDPEHL